MNEARTPKLCPKHQVELDDSYCPVCYPHPRVFCIGCGQPLTSQKHRDRREGARCYQNRKKKERQPHMKEDVEYVEFIYRRKYSDLGDQF